MIERAPSQRWTLLVTLGLAACSREPEPASASAPAPGGEPSAPPVEATPRPTSAPAAAPTPASTETPPGSPVEATAIEPASGSAPIVVAGDGGVIEVGLDGAVIRTLAKAPGRSPRWLPGKHALVFLGTENGATRDLRMLTLADGAERTVAALSLRPPCPRKAYEAKGEPVPELDLQTEDELRVTPRGDYVCLNATDHEADLRTIDLELAIRLADGHVTSALRFGGDECGREDEEPPTACAPAAGSGEEPAAEAEALASPFANAHVESRSPDGRWLLVELRSVLGDVLHRQLVLHDARTKQTYPLPRDGKGEWPAPLKEVPPTTETNAEEMIPGLPEVGGGEAIAWVGDHHLVLGRTLFVAGERIVALPGDVAQ